MISLNSNNVISLSIPVEGREYTRYFSGFPLTSLDQEVICYHKKQFVIKNWKDVGSGVEVFMCREAIEKDNLEDIINVCNEFGKTISRDDIIHGIQVHVPLTGERMGKEQFYADMVTNLWSKGYVIVHTLMQTKDYPLVQWSITDPTLLTHLVKDNVQKIGAEDRRSILVEQLYNWCEENDYNTEAIEDYDIIALRCDS